MTALLHAHSGVRYLVLLFGLIHVVFSLMSLVQKKPVTGAARGLSAAFMGTLHLQIVLGISGVILGTWYPALIGHLVMMLAAGALATAMHVINKRSPAPNHVRPLIGTGGALLLIIGGILSIGRSIVGSAYGG